MQEPSRRFPTSFFGSDATRLGASSPVPVVGSWVALYLGSSPRTPVAPSALSPGQHVGELGVDGSVVSALEKLVEIPSYFCGVGSSREIFVSSGKSSFPRLVLPHHHSGSGLWRDLMGKAFCFFSYFLV